MWVIMAVFFFIVVIISIIVVLLFFFFFFIFIFVIIAINVVVVIIITGFASTRDCDDVGQSIGLVRENLAISTPIKFFKVTKCSVLSPQNSLLCSKKFSRCYLSLLVLHTASCLLFCVLGCQTGWTALTYCIRNLYPYTCLCYNQAWLLLLYACLSACRPGCFSLSVLPVAYLLWAELRILLGGPIEVKWPPFWTS